MSPHTAGVTAPDASEYAPYYGRYISLVPGNDVLAALERQAGETAAMLSGLTEEQGGFRYAPGKWSVKEVLGHINDTERIMSYRALRIARGDRQAMPGFEQDDYVREANSGARPLAELLDEFAVVRRASLLLFRSFEGAAWLRRGVASGHEVSVRALAHIVAGHELHHRRILQERYFAKAADGRPATSLTP